MKNLEVTLLCALSGASHRASKRFLEESIAIKKILSEKAGFRGRLRFRRTVCTEIPYKDFESQWREAATAVRHGDYTFSLNLRSAFSSLLFLWREAAAAAYNGELCRGQKPLRFVRAFLIENACDLSEIDLLIAKLSAIRREVKARYMLSFHPIDILRMSMGIRNNGNHWRSCHAPGGEYFSGTLSYCFDSSSAVIMELSKHKNDGVNLYAPARRAMVYFDHSGNALLSMVYPDKDPGFYKAAFHVFDAVHPAKYSLESETYNCCLETESPAPFVDYYTGCRDSALISLETDKTKVLNFVVGAEEWISLQSGRYSSGPEECYECAECGHRGGEEDFAFIRGQYYCPDCTSYCEECGESVPSSEIHGEVDGKYICEECYYSSVYTCEECGEGHFRQNMQCSEDGDYYCEACYADIFGFCEECETEVKHADLQRFNSSLLCEECYNRAEERAE